MVLAVAWLDRDTAPVRLLAGLLSLPVAAIAYHYFENPVRFHPRLAGSLPRTFAMGVGATLMLLGVSAGLSRYRESAIESGRYADVVSTKARGVGVPCPKEVSSIDGIKYCLAASPDRAGQTVMLIGDSHAEQWIGPFAESAERADARLVVRAQSVCPSLDIRVTSFEGIEKPTCAKFREDTLRLIDELSPDAIVISNYNGYRDQVLRADGSFASRMEQPRLWGEAFASHISELGKKAERVGVLVDNPRLPADPLVCMSRRGNSIAGCESTRKVATQIVGPFQEAEAETIELGGVKVFGVTDRICTADRCDLQQDGVLVYVDRDHLSPAWVARQGASVDEFLESLLSRPS